MRLLSFSWAQTLISSTLIAPEPSKSLASRNMQSRMNCVARPPFCSSSKLISLSREAEMWMMSCGSVPVEDASTTKLRVFTFTGRPHSSEMPANLGRSRPSSPGLEKPRERTVDAFATKPPEWHASYITISLSVLLVMGLSNSAISRLVSVPFQPPS